MKKILGLSLIVTAASILSACGMAIPPCNDELNECGRGLAYTEERTAQANAKRKNFAKVKAEPMPEVQPMPAPPPAPAPAPEPAPIVDTQVIQSAEPMVTHVSK